MRKTYQVNVFIEQPAQHNGEYVARMLREVANLVEQHGVEATLAVEQKAYKELGDVHMIFGPKGIE